MLSNEDKKIVADYMKWIFSEYGGDYYYIPKNGKVIYFDLNDAGLVVAEMQKRGELYFFLTWIDNNLPYKGWSNFIAWIFNPENFFLAFCEWRKGK
jgi:hypothetical protein